MACQCCLEPIPSTVAFCSACEAAGCPDGVQGADCRLLNLIPQDPTPRFASVEEADKWLERQ